MAHRINVILDSDAWDALQAVPRGERSKLICEAIKKHAEIERRAKAVRQMDAVRRRLPSVSTRELVSWIKEDRKRET